MPPPVLTRKQSGAPLMIEPSRASAKASPQEGLRLATEMWSAGGKLEMATLADRLGITRVTLFRWFGNRDELLAEILWLQWSLVWDEALKTAKGAGPDYIANVCRRVMTGLLRSESMSSFIADDPEYALRLLTSKNSSVQSRVIGSVQELLLGQMAKGQLAPPIEVEPLAYAMVRIVESFIYSDQIAGRKTDLEVPAQIITLILRPEPIKGRTP